MILDTILEQRKKQLQNEQSKISLFDMIEKAKKTQKEKNAFYKALSNSKELFIISEIKKASPSKGIIAEDFDPVQIAKAYDKAEVQALSVLTEEAYFKGSSQYLMQAREQTSKPILRKDFIFDPYQIYEARAIGSDCILLIVAMLSADELKSLIEVAQSIDMDVLVEVHDEQEALIAVEAGAKIIGINNRNLKDFTVDLKTTEKVKKVLPQDCYVISESGIHTREDFAYLESLGVHGVLIGESLMRAPNIEKKVLQLRGKDHDED